MKPPTLLSEAQIISLTERAVGEKVWRSLYPRIYSYAPSGYCSPKLPGAMLASAVVDPASRHPFDKPIVAKLIAYSMPTMWLSKPLAESLRQTVPPATYNLLDLKLPLPAMTILLPQDSIVSRGSQVRFFSYARYEADELPGNDKAPHLFLVSGCVDGTLQSLSLGPKTAEVSLGDLDAFMQRVNTPGNYQKDETGNGVDDERNKQVVFYFLSCMLALTARPELMTEPKLLNRVQHKRKAPREFWSPRILGATYRAKREAPATGEHQSPRLHWVRGFYREQPVGPREERRRKTLWIEPFLRGV